MWINNKKNISVEVEKGGKRYNYDLNDSMFTAVWLPFIVAVPFKTPKTKKEEMMHVNLYNNLIGKMSKDIAFEEKDVDEIWTRPAKEDIGVANFMSKHGLVIKEDRRSREEFYFINKSIYESLHM